MGVVVFTKVLGHAKSQSPRTLRVLGLSDFTSPWTFAKTTTLVFFKLFKFRGSVPLPKAAKYGSNNVLKLLLDNSSSSS